MQLLICRDVLQGYSSELNEFQIRLPEGITRIRHCTFRGWNTLQSVQLPESLTHLEYRAFEFCETIPEIHLPERLEYIGQACFWGCKSLENVTIPEHVSHIGTGAFAEFDALQAIHVDERNPCFTSIDGVLYNKAVTELYCCPAGKFTLHLPETVKIIRKFAFAGCHFPEEISFPENVIYDDAN